MSTPAGQSAFFAGLRLAVSMLTVLPARVDRVNRRAAGVAMSLAPAIGAGLGASVAAIGAGLVAAGSSPLVAAAVVVTGAAILTRALHLDGLADTADGLGSYRSGGEALEIMKKSDVGPFGVVAIVLALLIQVASVTSILARPPLAAVAAVAAAAATGRASAALACRRGIPAARDTGLGVLVAETVATPTVVIAALGLSLLAIPAVPERPWQGPLAVVGALGLCMLLVRHTVRRLGGITGDVLGAAIEVTSTLALLVLAVGPGA